MIRRFLALCLLITLAGCGLNSGRSQADQDRDGRMLAAAIQAVDSQGTGFAMDESLVLTGGGVPSGQALSVHATSSDGVAREGNARLTYHIQSGRSGVAYDMFLSGTQLYAKRHGTEQWLKTPLSSTTSFFPALRLELVRETVLLAASVSGSSLTHTSAGFARKYVVKPAADQLEQLQAIVVQGRSEATFLKGASGELDLFFGVTGDRLQRVEVHVTGVDPSGGTRQRVDNWVDLRPARVAPIQPPAAASPVAPEGIFQ
ncbi:MAG: hypothetical protein DLM67_14650 [Candidatus Nephthysia bennettiae]|uniref:LppX_LprAFG lipoprotein n=1 Tax=Candidatus Nephthysia bennettiae TaxID=3127016 RepID=A0A934K7C4_9BACT|nr:hypothetical protein [Candidatus Dormibacteraeota bacterium]MBJ7611343.1 hypothetical protein [Candidatus Dormibacteraeota bacterium]PZR92715.1 MAG: hypothetical protein DLM67_14650 [Candidatus Dormibacteraeota bacterium]